jgi:hypothetical protein
MIAAIVAGLAHTTTAVCVPRRDWRKRWLAQVNEAQRLLVTERDSRFQWFFF